MPDPTVVPFLSKSTLFIAGMVGRCESLGIIVAYAARDDTLPSTRKDRIVEMLFRSLPVLPALEDLQGLEPLAAMSRKSVWLLSERQRRATAVALRNLWEKSVLLVHGDIERDFCRRCGIILTEICLRSIRYSVQEAARSLKNA